MADLRLKSNWLFNAGNVVIGFALALTLILVCASIEPAFAQSGSTGGSLGKTNKSVSGSVKKPVRSSPKSTKTKKTAALPLQGEWRFDYSCSLNKGVDIIKFNHSSPTSFTGSSIGISSGCNTKIYNGHITGSAISYNRKVVNCPDLGPRSINAQLSNANTLKGRENGGLWSCDFVGIKTK